MLLKKKEVIKHSATIQIPNEITLLQRKAWNALLANAFDDLGKKDAYQVSIYDLAQVLEFDSNNIEYLKEALRILNRTQIEWNILEKDKEVEWGVFTLLSSARIINGVCYYAYDSFLRKQLHDPALFSRINLSLQNKFKSKHSLAIYELALDYLRVKGTGWLSMALFRKLLGLKDNEYKTFKALNRDILKKTKKEVNKKTGLTIDFKFQKTGRGGKVTAIKLCVEKNLKNIIDLEKLKIKPKQKLKQISLPFVELEVDNQELYQTLVTEFGISNNKAIEFLKNRDEFYIKDVLEVVRETIKKGKVKNISAFTVRAIEEDYRHKKSQLDTEKKKKPKVMIDKIKEESQKERIEKEEHQKFINLINDLPEKEKDKIKKEAEKRIWKEFGMKKDGTKRKKIIGFKGFVILEQVNIYKEKVNK